MIHLRPYQTEAIAAFVSGVSKGDKRGIIVFSTGTGKTITGLALAKQMRARTLWIAHREELITQPIRALRQVCPEVKYGVVKAERNEWNKDFVFASVQSAWRPGRFEKLKGFDLVVVDECHRGLAKSYRKVIEAAGCFEQDGPALLGLTATPERTDAGSLEKVFDRIVYQYPIRKAVEEGYLVNVEMVERRINVDLDKVGMTGGDFSEGRLNEALLQADIVKEVGDAIDHLARDKKTIIFTVSVKQAALIAADLKKRGLAAAYVSGQTPKDERKKLGKDLASGKITHVANCQIYTEGFDEPTIESVVMARPTVSKSLWIQMAGRGLRIAPRKDKCTIIDMVGNSNRHNLIQAPVIFGIEDETEKKKREPSKSDECSHRDPILLTQVNGVATLERSSLKWVRGANGVYAISCGEGGNVIMRPTESHWWVEVIGRKDSGIKSEPLTLDPVDMELAQGIAEDYVRRSAAVYLSSNSAKWRLSPATPKQIAALKRMKITHSEGITKGDASDLITSRSAGSWRNEPATSKQIYALKRMGAVFDEDRITKGEAGRLMAKDHGNGRG